jgi:hypothetical protein
LPEKINRPPRLISLTSDKPSPQEAGTAITWTAEAKDQDNDQIFYNFFLNGDPITGWTKDDTWIWTTTDRDIGENQIEIHVRDGKHGHALLNGFDSNKMTSFTITISKPEPAKPENLPPATMSYAAGFLLLDYGESAPPKPEASLLVIKGLRPLRQGNYDLAITDFFDEAIKIDPNEAVAWACKGWALIKQDKYDEAIKCLDEAIRLEPNYVKAWSLKGLALIKQGKYDEAIKALDEAIRLDTKFGTCSIFCWFVG